MFSVTLVGRLGKDPEVKTKGDKGHTVFNLAVDAGKDATGARRTTWVKVHCYGRSQQFVKEHLKKGDQAVIIGKADIYAYAGNDGKPVATGDVFADVVEKFWPPKAGDTTARVVAAAPQVDEIPDF
jgi:single stranded DNA-binding protein